MLPLKNKKYGEAGLKLLVQKRTTLERLNEAQDTIHILETTLPEKAKRHFMPLQQEHTSEKTASKTEKEHGSLEQRLQKVEQENNTLRQELDDLKEILRHAGLLPN